MKFKSIFIIFNTIIVLSFLLIFFMPLLVLGAEYAGGFWSQSWYLLLLFLVVLTGLDTYFIKNWRVFQYLESEDWVNLSSYLENRIYNQGRISHQQVNLLINSYLMQNKLAEITTLSDYLKLKQPRLQRRDALSLGLPVLLRNNADEILGYYGQYVDESEDVDPWILWNYSFGLLMKGDRGRAKEFLLITYAEAKNDKVLKLLAVYMLDSFRDEDEQVELKVNLFLNWLTQKYTLNRWLEKVNKHKDNLQLFVLQRIVQEASQWAYNQRSKPTAQGDTNA